MDWNILLEAFLGLVGIIGGSVGIIFWRENKKLKQQEVKSAQLDNDKKIIEEWKDMYHEKEKKCNEKDAIIRQHVDKIDRLYQERNDAREEVQKRELRIQQLTWYHCTVNNCKNRIPPHVFDLSGREICLTEEAQQP